MTDRFDSIGPRPMRANGELGPNVFEALPGAADEITHTKASLDLTTLEGALAQSLGCLLWTFQGCPVLRRSDSLIAPPCAGPSIDGLLLFLLGVPPVHLEAHIASAPAVGLQGDDLDGLGEGIETFLRGGQAVQYGGCRRSPWT